MGRRALTLDDTDTNGGAQSFKLNAPLVRLISFIVLIVVWELASYIVQDRTLPSVLVITDSFYQHLAHGTLLYDLGITLWRVFAAFVIAMAFGTVIGILMGLYKSTDVALDGWLILFLNVPALVTIILCYVWFGLNEIAAIVAVALNKFPNVVVTMREGTRAIDRDLLQVAEVFRVSRRRWLMHFFLPQLYPYLMVSGRSGLALIWKIVLVVELLGRSDGIGFQLQSFFSLFDMASIIAYTMAFVVVMMAVEFGIVGPLDRHITRWRLS